MLSLHPDWRRLLRRAWSTRLILVAGALSGAEVALPLFPDALPRGLFGVASALVSCAALIARLVAQKEFTDARDHQG